MASRYTHIWDENTPTATDIMGYMYQHMQNLKTDVRERMQYPAWPVGYKLLDLGTVSAGTVSLDLSIADTFLCVLPSSGIVTFQIINAPVNTYDEKVMSMVTLVIKMPSSGTPTVAWASNIKYPTGSATLSTTNDTYSIIQFITFDGGANYILMPLVTGVSLS